MSLFSKAVNTLFRSEQYHLPKQALQICSSRQSLVHLQAALQLALQF